MRHSAGVFRGSAGVDLYCQSWHPDGPARAALVIVHGWGEHSARYAHVVRYFSERAYVIFGFDQRGHGHSPGQRGHVQSWAEYRRDLHNFVGVVRERHPELPVFLFGHSLGSVIALDYLLHHPEGLRGAVLSASAVEPVGVAKPHLVAFGRVMSRVWSTFAVSLPLEVSALSRDPEVVQSARTDPLMHHRGSVRWGTEVLEAIAWVKAHAAEVAIPTLFLHGEVDQLNLAKGTRRVFDAVTHADKTLRIYPGMYHELHNDVGREHVLRDVGDWLRQRT